VHPGRSCCPWCGPDRRSGAAPSAAASTGIYPLFDSYSLLQPYGLMRHVFGRITSVANVG
jgi:hypothetical protein